MTNREFLEVVASGTLTDEAINYAKEKSQKILEKEVEKSREREDKIEAIRKVLDNWEGALSATDIKRKSDYPFRTASSVASAIKFMEDIEKVPVKVNGRYTTGYLKAKVE